MTFIQTAFDRSVSQLSNARFLNWFKPFLASVRHWKVENSWKTRSNPWISKSEFEAVGVSFSKNRQKWLSTVAKSFLRVVKCYNLYQEIAWTLSNVFYMHNLRKKCVEKILRTKNEALLSFEKAISDTSQLSQGMISSKLTKMAPSCPQIISTCCEVL